MLIFSLPLKALKGCFLGCQNRHMGQQLVTEVRARNSVLESLMSILLLRNQERRSDIRLDGSESRFLRRNRIGFERKINLRIICIEVHVGEVSLNDIQEWASERVKRRRPRQEPWGSLYLTGVSSEFQLRMEMVCVLLERYDLNRERCVTNPEMCTKAGE